MRSMPSARRWETQSWGETQAHCPGNGPILCLSGEEGYTEKPQDRPYLPGLTAPPEGRQLADPTPVWESPKSSPGDRGEPLWGVEEPRDGELKPLRHSAEACQALESSSHRL